MPACLEEDVESIAWQIEALLLVIAPLPHRTNSGRAGDDVMRMDSVLIGLSDVEIDGEVVGPDARLVHTAAHLHEAVVGVIEADISHRDRRLRMLREELADSEEAE